MNKLVPCFIQLWIILNCLHVINTAILLNRHENKSETGDIDLKKNTSEPVTYDLEQWLANQIPTKKKFPNLTILPILALLSFLWIVCLRICNWIREDSKFDERGCSYDVTSYVIVTQEDKDFHDVNHSNSHLLYDTITSSRSLQHRIDDKMYDTVTSYTSILRQSNAKNARRSPTPDHCKNEIPHPKDQLQKKGRFYITPVIDNYVRLKNRSDGKPTPNLDYTNVRENEMHSMNYCKNKFVKSMSKRAESDSRLVSGSMIARLNRKNTLVEAKRARMKVGWKTNNGKDVLPGKMKDMNHVRRDGARVRRLTLKCNSSKQQDKNRYSGHYSNDFKENCVQSPVVNSNLVHTTVVVHKEAENSQINHKNNNSSNSLYKHQSEQDELESSAVTCSTSNFSRISECINEDLILSADNYSGKNECICSKCAVLGETPTNVFLDLADLISSHENGDFCTSPPTSILNVIDDTGISFIKRLDSISDDGTGTIKSRLVPRDTDNNHNSSHIGKILKHSMSEPLFHLCKSDTFHMGGNSLLENSGVNEYSQSESPNSECVLHSQHCKPDNDTFDINEAQETRRFSESQDHDRNISFLYQANSCTCHYKNI